jgi:S-methylmethionine-dependent homocysteine/selenocysteine methylase
MPSTLPHLDRGLHVTDGGLETVLVFHDGLDLPQFAAFPLLATDEGTARLRAYYDPYAEIAVEHGAGLVLESPTWRASSNWAEVLGIPLDELDELNRRAIALLEDVRDAYADRIDSIVISGCIGPEGDGYSPATRLTAEAAEAYHAQQIGVFVDAGVDLVTALTMTYAEEAIGITRAARARGVPVAISFTVETDGRLPSGQPLADAVAQVDAATGGGPDYYMVNCAHPTHFADVLEQDAAWVDRIRGVRANASTKSHAELDEAEALDAGDPAELAARHRELAEVLSSVAVLGGCCGTDHRHVGEIVAAWARA